MEKTEMKPPTHNPSPAKAGVQPSDTLPVEPPTNEELLEHLQPTLRVGVKAPALWAALLRTNVGQPLTPIGIGRHNFNNHSSITDEGIENGINWGMPALNSCAAWRKKVSPPRPSVVAAARHRVGGHGGHCSASLAADLLIDCGARLTVREIDCNYQALKWDLIADLPAWGPHVVLAEWWDYGHRFRFVSCPFDKAREIIAKADFNPNSILISLAAIRLWLKSRGVAVQ